MADTTDISHSVSTPGLVGRVAGSFRVDHDLFPTVTIRWDDWGRGCLLRHFSELDARQTEFTPCLDVGFHLAPPGLTNQNHTSLLGVPVCPADTIVALQKQPTFPGQMGSGLPVGYDWYP